MFLFYCVQTLNSLLFSYKWRPYVKSVLSSAQEKMFSEIVPNKKFTDLQMNKEQFNFIFFFPDFLPPNARREIGGYGCTGLLSTVHES